MISFDLKNHAFDENTSLHQNKKNKKKKESMNNEKGVLTKKTHFFFSIEFKLFEFL